MGIFNWWKKPKTHPGNNFDDEQRALALRIRQQRAEQKRMRDELDFEREKLRHELEMERMQAQLDDLRAEYDDEEEEPSSAGGVEEALLTSLISGYLGKQTATPPPPSTPPAPTKRHYSDTEIKVMLDGVPKKMRKIVAKLPDEALLSRAATYAPDADDDSIQRAIAMVRNW